MPGRFAFKLYDTYGFPLDLTELMARERYFRVATDEFDKLMEEQRARARAAQKKEVISLSQIEITTPTKFVGFEQRGADAKILEVVSINEKSAVVLDVSPFYAEMGGQVGDTGEMVVDKYTWKSLIRRKAVTRFCIFLETESILKRRSYFSSNSGLEGIPAARLSDFLHTLPSKVQSSSFG
jgi:alanyl-tRNA synthetase